MPAYAAVRTVRELLDCGLTIEEIADAADRPPAVIEALLQTQLISQATAEAIKVADEKLMGPVPPPDDIDEVVVERLMYGRRYSGPVRVAERREAVRRLRLAGHSATDIAGRLHVPSRMVQRDVSLLGLSRRYRKAAA